MAVAKGIKKRSEDEGKAELARVLPAKNALVVQQERLQKIQDDLLERSLQVVDASVRFAEVDPGSTEPPAAWVEQYGQEEAAVRARIARAGWLPTKDAPMAIRVAASVAVGIMRAKAQEKNAPVALNIAVVKMTAPMPYFPEQEIEVGR